MRIGISNAQDFMALLVRRKWWVVAPFLAISGAAAVLIYCLPSTYVSEALIWVRPRDVPESYVPDLISGTSGERLTAIEQTVRSRTNLIQIYREFADRLPELRPLNMDLRVERLASQIDIAFQAQASRGRTVEEIVTFTIAYQDQDPELAQQIASKLTDLFIQQDQRVREDQVYGTTEFLRRELDRVAAELSTAEEDLEAVKSRVQFALPEQLNANLGILQRLSAERQANRESIDRYESMRLTLELQLSETPPALPSSEVPELVVRDALAEQYRQAKLVYEGALDRYTPEHPRVRTARLALDRLRAQVPADVAAEIDAAVAADPGLTDVAGIEGAGTDTAETAAVEAAGSDPPAGESVPNPVHQTLTAQLAEVVRELDILQRTRRDIDAGIARYSARVDNAPAAESEIREVLRRQTDLQEQHDNLRRDLAEAELSRNLEGRQQAGQFVVIDPANTPVEPAKPNKLAVALGALAGSLALAVGLAVAVDVLRQKIWTPSEVEMFWGAPVLIDIPEILTDSDLARVRKKKMAAAVSSVGAAAVYGFGLYLMYLQHDFIFRQLDPLIQRLVY